MLNVKFQIIRRQNKSLNYKNLKLYRIITKINNITYKFQLSTIITNVFLVFHF